VTEQSFSLEAVRPEAGCLGRDKATRGAKRTVVPEEPFDQDRRVVCVWQATVPGGSVQE